MSKTYVVPGTAERKPLILLFVGVNGVGKTTTTVNLAAALVLEGKRVAILDLDPQGNASTALGVDSQDRDKTAYDLFVGRNNFNSVMVELSEDGLFLVPSTVDLSLVDLKTQKKGILINALKDELNKNNLFEITLVTKKYLFFVRQHQ